MQEININKFLSGRFVSTVFLVATYCLCVITITIAGAKLLWMGNELGEKVLVYIIGNLTGTAIGAVVAYHFKKENGGGQ